MRRTDETESEEAYQRIAKDEGFMPEEYREYRRMSNEMEGDD